MQRWRLLEIIAKVNRGDIWGSGDITATSLFMLTDIVLQYILKHSYKTLLQNDVLQNKNKEGMDVMPPKPKYTKEEIVKTAFQMTREKGFGSVTARELGKRLGTSATPIFTVFKSMKELQLEVSKLALEEYETYVADALSYTPAFKQIGVQMIQFATDEPQLFRLLCMRIEGKERTFDEMFHKMGDWAEVCIDILRQEHGLTREDAETLFRQAWISTFSVCVLMVNNMCQFSSEEIIDVLGMSFQGTLLLIKSGQYKKVDIHKIFE